ncbi:unnamed protein product, partial [Timema podura]|nr:unnamed protein product [Timema podura]
AVLGLSPISIAAPVLSSDDLIFDMTATAVSVGKIHEHHKKGLPLDEGWALGPDGKTTTDPTAALQAKCLMPLGGTSGYKGYGLALAVETLSAILAGASFSPKVRPWISRDDTPAGLGQSYVVIDPGFFAPGFGERMAKLLDNLRNLEPAPRREWQHCWTTSGTWIPGVGLTVTHPIAPGVEERMATLLDILRKLEPESRLDGSTSYRTRRRGENGKTAGHSQEFGALE